MLTTSFPKVIFGTSCLGNLFQEIPYEVKKEIAEPGMDADAKKALAVRSRGRFSKQMLRLVDGEWVRRTGFQRHKLKMQLRVRDLQRQIAGTEVSDSPLFPIGHRPRKSKPSKPEPEAKAQAQTARQKTTMKDHKII